MEIGQVYFWVEDVANYLWYLAGGGVPSDVVSMVQVSSGRCQRGTGFLGRV